MMEYELVYDLRSVPLLRASQFLWIALLVLLLVLVLILQSRGPAAENPRPFISLSRGAIIGFFGFILLLAAGSSAAGYLQARWVRDQLQRGEYVHVEGRVEGFTPGDRGGHRDEVWSVRSGGRTYTYRYRWSRRIPGFHRSAGPVREGVRVRIADVNGYIARLEIER